jgi:hypothetical protein
MSQQTSAEVNSSPEAAEIPTVEQAQTALDALSFVAKHHGIDLTIDRVRHLYAIGHAPVTQALLLRITKEAGMRARVTRLNWRALLRLGEAYPALAQLANGNWVVVLAACDSHADEEAVSIFDPLAERPEPLIVKKASFVPQLERRRDADQAKSRASPDAAEVRISLVHPRAVARTEAVWRCGHGCCAALCARPGRPHFLSAGH